MPFNLGFWIPSTFLAAATIAAVILSSIYSIGPTEVGLVRRRFGAKLPGDNRLAFRGEAGYQAELLMPGLRFKLWLVYAVTKHLWVQVPAAQIGRFTPVAFVVITKPEVIGVPTSADLSARSRSKGALSYRAFGLDEKQLDVMRISPRPTEAGRVIDIIGIVTALEGDPLPTGDIASRLGGFTDIHALEASGDGTATTDAKLSETTTRR